jgi:flagellar assembly factor FliW
MSAVLMEAPAGTTELLFESGLPGFSDAHRFTLVRWGDDESPFSIMRSLDHEGLEFVVIPPIAFFPDYEPELDDSTVERLELESAGDAVVLAMVTLGDRAADATANLLGPIVVNRHSRRAAQAVLVNSEYDLRAPLVPA